MSRSSVVAIILLVGIQLKPAVSWSDEMPVARLRTRGAVNPADDNPSPASRPEGVGQTESPNNVELGNAVGTTANPSQVWQIEKFNNVGLGNAVGTTANRSQLAQTESSNNVEKPSSPSQVGSLAPPKYSENTSNIERPSISSFAESRRVPLNRAGAHSRNDRNDSEATQLPVLTSRAMMQISSDPESARMPNLNGLNEPYRSPETSFAEPNPDVVQANFQLNQPPNNYQGNGALGNAARGFDSSANILPSLGPSTNSNLVPPNQNFAPQGSIQPNPGVLNQQIVPDIGQFNPALQPRASQPRVVNGPPYVTAPPYQFDACEMVTPAAYYDSGYDGCGVPSYAPGASPPGAGINPYAYPPTLTPNLAPGVFSPNNSGFRPLFTLGQENYNVQLGRGIIGQPTAYVSGQPVRNFMRYLFP